MAPRFPPSAASHKQMVLKPIDQLTLLTQKAFDDSVASLQKNHPELRIVQGCFVRTGVPRSCRRAGGSRRASNRFSKDQTFVGDDGLVYKYHADGKMPDVTGSFELANTQPIKAEIATEPFTYTNAKGEQVQAGCQVTIELHGRTVTFILKSQKFFRRRILNDLVVSRRI